MGLRIALDADGVIFNFIDAWLLTAEMLTGRKPVQETYNWDLGKCYGLSQKQVADIWFAFDVAGMWGLMQALPGAADTLNTLIDENHEIHVITAIDPVFAGQRMSAIDRILGRKDHGITLHCVGHNGSKAEKLSEINPHLFADDYSHHIETANAVGIGVIVHITNNNEDPHALATHAMPTIEGIPGIVRSLAAPKKQSVSG